MPYIETIDYDEASGRLRQEYDSAVRRAGSVANVISIQSLNSGVLRANMRLYMAVMHQDSSLSRAERELIATVVSAENDCFY